MQVLKGLIEWISVTWSRRRKAVAAARASAISDSALGLAGLARRPTTLAAGTHPSNNSSCFGASEVARKMKTIIIRPGRLIVDTETSSTPSQPHAENKGA